MRDQVQLSLEQSLREDFNATIGHVVDEHVHVKLTAELERLQAHNEEACNGRIDELREHMQAETD